jgi:hypothetical protein
LIATTWPELGEKKVTHYLLRCQAVEKTDTERVLPLGEDCFPVHFAAFSIGLLDIRKLCILPLPRAGNFDIADAGEGDDPFPSLNQGKQDEARAG